MKGCIEVFMLCAFAEYFLPPPSEDSKVSRLQSQCLYFRSSSFSPWLNIDCVELIHAISISAVKIMIHANMNITHFSFIYSDRNNCYANIWFPNRFNFSNWSLFRKWDPLHCNDSEHCLNQGYL